MSEPRTSASPEPAASDEELGAPAELSGVPADLLVEPAPSPVVAEALRAEPPGDEAPAPADAPARARSARPKDAQRFDRADVYRGATWVAGGFAAMTALGLVSSLFGVVAVLMVDDVLMVANLELAAGVLTLALRVGVVFYVLRQLAGPPTLDGPSWLVVIGLCALALLSIFGSTAAAAFTSQMISRTAGAESLSAFFMRRAIGQAVLGTLGALLPLGYFIAAAVLWSRRLRRR